MHCPQEKKLNDGGELNYFRAYRSIVDPAHEPKSIGPIQWKHNTELRNCVSVKERLVDRVRFLAIGDAY